MHPASPLGGQCETYTRQANGNYKRCRNRAAVVRNGKKVCYGCNVSLTAKGIAVEALGLKVADERTDADAIARSVQPGMYRYRIHNTDRTTTTIEARSIGQAHRIAVSLDRSFERIEGV